MDVKNLMITESEEVAGEISTEYVPAPVIDESELLGTNVVIPPVATTVMSSVSTARSR